MLHYVAMDEDGAVLGVEEHSDDAVDDAIEAYPDRAVRVEQVDEFEDNPPSKAMPRNAAKRTGLRKISERDSMDMDIDEAQQRLLPYFAGLMIRGSAVRVYNTVPGMLKAWIGQNYKTSKETPGVKVKTMGLSLAPYDMVANQLLRLKTFGRRARRQLPTGLPSNFTLCAGSNDNCRSSCLVYAGQNASEIYNTYRKGAQTLALLNEPEAFLRMTYAAVKRHECEAPTEGYEPFMRMNVLSDIPWEVVAPWFFERIPDIQFYDYTKVGHRDVPGNYDITFSFSGTNEKLAKRELDELDRKVAVVFLAHKPAGQGWKAWKRAPKGGTIPLPRSFWGREVVDGDVSDARPLDPPGSIVGLRWKSPSGKRAGVEVDPSDPAFTFVVPVYVVDSAASLRDNAWSRPNPNREQWLVAPVTPRFQNIEHDVAQPMGGW